MRPCRGLTHYAGDNQEGRPGSNHDQSDQDSDPKEEDLAFIFGFGRSDSYHIMKSPHDLQKVFHNWEQKMNATGSKDSTSLMWC